jgi:cobaltochelatase CobS
LGRGDESGLYTGTNVLNASHLDRWNVVYSVGYPEPGQEAAIVREKAPELPPALVEGMVNLARDVRKAVAEEQLYTTFSTRRLLAFARKISSLGLGQALAATVLNKLTAEERRVVAELAQRHLPGLKDAA